ncbi:MAG: alcohol dehydrogenase catalytic domain-containing protein [Candidatus Hodarchaeales archaeon]
MNTTDIIDRSGRLPNVISWSFRQVITPLFRMFDVGIRKPRRKVLGTSFSGEIVAVGPDVTDWKAGDHIYGYSRGACAEYLAVPASKLARKPASISFQEAGAVPGAGRSRGWNRRDRSSSGLGSNSKRPEGPYHWRFGRDRDVCGANRQNLWRGSDGGLWAQ